MVSTVVVYVEKSFKEKKVAVFPEVVLPCGLISKASLGHLFDLFLEFAHLLLVPRKAEVNFIALLGRVVCEVEMAVSTDASGENHVLLLHGDAFGVDAAEVCVLEQSNDVGFGGFLQCDESLRLVSEFSAAYSTSDVSHESLERSTREEVAHGLLVAADLTECVSASLGSALDSTCCGGSFLRGCLGFLHALLFLSASDGLGLGHAWFGRLINRNLI